MPPPRQRQIGTINSAANPMRQAASQNGVIPSSATSVTRNVAPHVTPSVATMTQLIHVMLRLSVM